MSEAREFGGVPIPDCMAGRPVDRRGFPVPWFVTVKDENGDWDFAQVEKTRWDAAFEYNRCWVSGEPLGAYKSFVSGPLGVVNLIAGDPPVKKELALWSVKVCPFLSRPLARRSEKDLGDITVSAHQGFAVNRNPGVTAIYTTKSHARVNSAVVRMGPLEDITWWCQGRPATRTEVQASLDEGLRIIAGDLSQFNTAQREDFTRRIEAFELLMPKEEPSHE